MRWLAALLAGALAAGWSVSAYADPISYTCARTSTHAFSRTGDHVEVSRFALDESEQVMLIDWQRNTLRIGPSSVMPIVVEDHRVVAIMQSVTPAAPGRPEQQLFGTYILDRATGAMSGNVHVRMVDSLVSLQFGYQCRTAEGATRF